LNHNLQGTALEPKERPHSFSGGLSSADLRRLQQMGDTSDDPGSQQWASNHLRENGALPNEQPMYPTLTQIHRPQPLSHPQLFDYRNAMHESAASDRDELQIDYNLSQRYPTAPQGLPMATLPPHPSFVAGRLNNVVPNVGYRQPPRVFPQQALLPNPSPLAFPVGHHTSHLSLGNTQQLYEMMIPSAPDSHPAVARVQQQHNIFRGGHHHSASDPSVMRDATSHSILNGIHSFNPGLYPPTLHPSMPVFPNQFYTTQDAVASRLADLSGVQFAAAYIPSQNTGTEVSATTPTAGTSQTGPSANNRKLGLYKTELCRSWEEKGTCRYGAKCQFAHGEDELRKVARHPKVRLHLYF
jgi:tristetraprolin